MVDSSDPPPFSSGGYQTTPRQLLQKKTFIKGDELSDSYLEALYTANHTEYLAITKWAIQKYLEACLIDGGQFRTFFKRFAPFTGGFVVNENFDGDKRKRHLQIARYFDGVVERPPQFFILDGGYTYQPASLGGLTGGWSQNDKYGNQVNHIFDSVPIPIDILFASSSFEDVDSMGAFWGMAFGQFQRYINNWYLQPDRAIKGAYWTVMLSPHFTVSPKSRQSLHGDPDASIWTSTMSSTVIFENSTYLTYRAAPQGDLLPGNFRINLPSKITLHTTVPISLFDIPYPVEVYTDDYKIAVVQEEATQYVLYPKRLGTCNIIVRKPGGTNTEELVLAKEPLQIVLR